MVHRVALDLGAVAPQDALAATRAALAADPDLELVLVGPGEPVGGADAARLHVRPAPGRLAPDVPADVAVRGTPDLPVRVAVELLAAGEVDRVVSAAPVTALVTAARFLLPRIVGVRDLLVVRTLHLGHEVTVLDASGTAGTTPVALARALELDPGLRAAGSRVGVLVAADEPDRAAHERLDAVRGVAPGASFVAVAEVLAGAVDVVATSGDSGRLLVDAVRALAPDAVGAGRLSGLAGHDVRTVAGDLPTNWSRALLDAAAVSA